MRFAASICIVLFVLLSCIGSQAQDAAVRIPYQEKQFAERPKIGLALSGGAAHGLAHIGLFKYLEEIGIPIDYVTGTSMGAIVGAMYAIGYDAEHCEQIAKDINWMEIFNNTPNQKDVAPIEKYSHDKYPITVDLKGNKLIIPEGIFSSNKLDLLLEEIFAPAYLKTNFDDFTIPFRCYAVDIVDGSIVELSKGRLTKALRASMAIPSIFSPLEIDSRMLVDGGLIRNFPVTNCSDLGADIIIGSYVGSDRGDAAELGSLFDILKQSAFMMSISDSELQCANADIVIYPDVKKESTFNFSNYSLLIERGYEAAQAHEAQFLELKRLLNQYPPAAVRVSMENPGYLFVNKIEIPDLEKTAASIVRQKLNIGERTYTTFGKIKEGIKAIYATKNFERVNFRLQPGTDGITLVVEARESKVTTLGANINRFNSTNASLILDMQARNYITSLSNLNVKLRLSEHPGLFTEFYRRGRLVGDGTLIGITAKVEELQLPFFDGSDKIRTMSLWQGSASPFFMWEPNNALNIKSYWKAEFASLANDVVTNNDIKNYHVRQYSTGLEVRYNTLDRQYFSNTGVSMMARAQYAYANNGRLELTGNYNEERIAKPHTYLSPRLSIESFLPVTSRLNLQMQADVSYRKTGYFLDNMYVGGSYQDRADRLPFIGLDEAGLHLATYAYGKVALRYNIYNQFYTTVVVNAIGGNSPIQPFVEEQPTTNFVSLIGAGLSFGVDLPIGPLYLDLGYVSRDLGFGAYFGLGYRHFY